MKSCKLLSIKSPPPALTFDWMPLKTVLELIFRNPHTFAGLKDDTLVSFEAKGIITPLS